MDRPPVCLESGEEGAWRSCHSVGGQHSDSFMEAWGQQAGDQGSFPGCVGLPTEGNPLAGPHSELRWPEQRGNF